MDTAAWTGAEFHPPTVCQLKWVSAIRKRENTAVILLYDLGDMDLGGEFFKQNITWDPRDESLLNKKNGRWIQDEFGLGRVFDIWYCGWNPVFDRYSFFHYRFFIPGPYNCIIQLCNMASFGMRSETLDDKPGVELQFIVGGAKFVEGNSRVPGTPFL